MNVKSQRKYSLFFVSIIFVGILVYLPSFQAPFIFDDIKIIERNPVIRSLDIYKIWSFDPSRFLTHWSFALNYHWTQLDLAALHWTNFLLHGLTVICVFFFTREIFRIGLQGPKSRILSEDTLAYFSAFLFCIHPLQTAAVTYIVQRATILAALCYIAALIFYLYFRRSQRPSFYALSLLCAFIGAFAKPIIITLPLVLIYWEAFFLKGAQCYDLKTFHKYTYRMPFKKAFFFLTPYFLLWLLVPFLLMIYTRNINVFEVSMQTDMISRKDYLFTQFNVLIKYIRLMFLPINQNFDYDYPIASRLFTFPTFLSFAILMSVLVSAILNVRKNKVYAFAVFFFFIALALESSIFPLSDVIFEHRLYLPMLSFTLLVPFLLLSFKKKRMIISGMIFILLIFCLLTLKRNNLWSRKILFLRDNVEKSHEKPRVHVNLGIAYLEEGAYEKARDSFYLALSKDPGYVKAYLGLGLTHQTLGEYSKALDYYEQAIDLDVFNDEAYNNSGVIYAIKDEPAQALKFFNAAINSNPDSLKAYNNRARLYEQLGQYELALKDYSRALALDPTAILMYLNRARVHASDGHLQEAKQDVEKAHILGYPHRDLYLQQILKR